MVTKIVPRRRPDGELRRAVAFVQTGEETFAALANHTPVGIFISDVEGRTLYVNQRWCELAGMEPAAALGDGWRKALHPDDAARIAPEWEKAAGEGRDSVAEYRFVRPDGSVAWIEGYAAALRDDDGRLLGWVGTCLDLTARKEAEEQFREAFDSAPIGMALVAPDGRWLEVNGALCRLLGYTAEELSGMTSLEVTHPDDLEVSREHTSRHLAGERSLRIEKRYIRKDGRPIWVALTSTLVHDSHGRPSHFVAQIEDVSERVQAQKALREAEERFRRAFEDAPIGMALVDLEGRWLRVNGRLCEITGYTEAALLGRSFDEIVHPDDLAARAAEAEGMRSGRMVSLSHELRCVRPNGKLVWVRVSSSLVRDADGRPLHTVCQIEDVSDRRRAEERLKDLADHDSLTGLLNRRRFDEELRTAILRIRRYGGSVGLLLLDVDEFKEINDTHGHKTGDDVLVAIAGALRGRLRVTDTVARLGGDEFAALVYETGQESARHVAEELAEAIRSRRVSSGDIEVAVTVSAGVVVLDHAVSGDEDDALVAVDRALYAAKSAGRDRVVVGS